MTSSVLRSSAIPFTAYPGFNRYTLDLLAGNPDAVRLSSRRDLSALRPAGKSKDGALAESLIDFNRRFGNEVEGAVGRWQRGESVTIIAGQQTGFAGGPLYTLAKIASMLELRERLRREGVDADVFFWLASEDHDFDEVTSALLQLRGENRWIRASERSNRRVPVGSLPLPQSLVRQYRDAGLQGGRWLEEKTLGSSFARLLSDSLRGREVVLVDSLLPELRRAGAEVLKGVAVRLAESNAAISERSRRIEAAGYAAPITAANGAFTLLYEIDDRGERVAVDSSNIDSFLRRLARSPERCSTAALVRPLLQDAVFDSDVFVGGPSEVAYYPQALALHELHGVRPPHVAVRGHALLATARIVEKMEKLGLSPAEVLAPVERVLEARRSDEIGAFREASEKQKEAIPAALLETLRPAVEADRALERSFRRSAHRMQSEMSRAIERAARAIARRDREEVAAIERVFAMLQPAGTPQDRVAAWLPWLERHGEKMIDRLIEGCVVDRDFCEVLSL
jgi:bacillithiol synthase